MKLIINYHYLLRIIPVMTYVWYFLPNEASKDGNGFGGKQRNTLFLDICQAYNISEMERIAKKNRFAAMEH